MNFGIATTSLRWTNSRTRRLVKMTHEAQGRVFMAQSKLLGDKASARWALPAELSGAGGEIGVVAIF